MEGRGWREQDWPIALAGISRPCSREVGPVVRLWLAQAGLQISGSKCPERRRIRFSPTHLLDDPVRGFPTPCQAAEGHQAIGRPECLGQGTLSGV